MLRKEESELQAILGQAYDDYVFALKKHGIKTIAGAMTTVSTATVSLLNGLQNGSMYYMSPYLAINT